MSAENMNNCWQSKNHYMNICQALTLMFPFTINNELENDHLG